MCKLRKNHHLRAQPLISQRATNRTFRPNLQKTIVMEKGHKVHKILCTKCIKAMGKVSA